MGFNETSTGEGNRLMNKLILLVLLSAWVCATSASEEGPQLMSANASLRSKSNLQRGAQTFVNYCLSCHSASYMRFSRLASDLGLDEKLVKENLMFTTDKIGDPMTVAMRSEDAANWFGVPPPDLSVIARARGADWLYSYLMSFHLDEKRPNGINNPYFPGTGMPHVLWELQGLQRLSEKETGETHGGPAFEMVVPGKLSASEYANTVRDLVSFLVYVGEPAKLIRYKVGFWVLAFLFVLFIATYLLKREYWKDVH
jgi:ubiquinol-cytochrome c reductase cytochrome c1 subunit